MALRPGAGNMVNGILRNLVLLKVCHLVINNSIEEKVQDKMYG